MNNWLSKTLLTAVAVFFISWFLPGVSIEESYLNAIFVAMALGLLNSFIKPILIILTLPATILSLGLFMLVINAFVVLIADYFLDGFIVDGFWWALIFSGLLSIISSTLHKMFLGPKTKSVNFSVNADRFGSNTNEQTTKTGTKIITENGKKTIIIEKD